MNSVDEQAWARGVLAAAGLTDEHFTVAWTTDGDVALHDAKTGLQFFVLKNGCTPAAATDLLNAALKLWLPPSTALVVPRNALRHVHGAMQQAVLAYMSGADPTADLRGALSIMAALLADRPAPQHAP